MSNLEDGTELKWFESYLTKRQQVCFVNGHTLSPRQITCGVPQDSINSWPIIVFINIFCFANYYYYYYYYYKKNSIVTRRLNYISSKYRYS